MNGAEKYRSIVLDAICQVEHVDEETASDMMHSIITSDMGIAIDHSFFAKLAMDILSYPNTDRDSIIERVRAGVEDTVRQFAVDMVNQFNSNPRKGKRDDDDILSQLEAMGFSFDATADYESLDHESERDFYTLVAAELDRLQSSAIEKVVQFGGDLFDTNPGQAHPEYGFDPRNPVYTEFILSYVEQSMRLPDDVIEEAPTILVAVFAKLFMDAIESDSGFDEYFANHKPDRIHEASRYAIYMTTKYWRKQPMLITALDLFSGMVRDGLSPMTIVPIISLCASLARFIYDSENIMPQNPAMDKHLSNIYSVLAQA